MIYGGLSFANDWGGLEQLLGRERGGQRERDALQPAGGQGTLLLEWVWVRFMLRQRMEIQRGET